MFSKKKLRLVENKHKMFHFPASLRNFKWRNCMVTFGVVGFALLLILGNFKSQSYYEKLKAAKENMMKNDSQVRSPQVFQSLDAKLVDCQLQNCTVTCSGDLTELKNYLQFQKTCQSIALQIFKGIFPEEKLQSNWLEGGFNLSSIAIRFTKIKEVQDGAFNQRSVSYVSELELNGVQLAILTENSFVGLKSIETFTLINSVKIFSGEAFLKPMRNTLKKLVIKHYTDIATNPAPWFRGENFPRLMTVVLDGSNFGEFLNAATFDTLKNVSILKMNSCQISSIPDGSFDFMVNQAQILISLQNNQLKRLDGEYLSGITNLRRLDIQNNPWDCTCELEHLVRVFKNHPEGFGFDSKCNTPPNLSGKSLNEVDLQKCEDDSSMSLATTTMETRSSTPKTITTVSATSSTILPPIKTTTYSADSIFIHCARPKDRVTNYYQPNVLELAPPDGHFKILSISETSARLIFEGTSRDLAVIWFYEQPSLDDNVGYVRIVGEFDVGCQNELNNSFLVEGLIVNRSYTFCLVKNGIKEISPFNCQSHFSTIVNINGEIWLSKKDRPLAIGVFVTGIVVSACFGLIGMFLLIRYNKCLFTNSKQTKVLRKNIGEGRWIVENCLTESSLGNSFNSKAKTVKLRRFSAETGLSYMVANNYEELDYQRINVNNDLIASYRVPKSPAPPLPNRRSGSTDRKTEALDDVNIYVVEQRDNCDGYAYVV